MPTRFLAEAANRSLLLNMQILIYVENGGGTSNVLGFCLERTGELRQIPDSIAFLSTGDTAPGSVSFSPDGRAEPAMLELFHRYAVMPNGKLSAISANVPTLGAATCWQAVTPEGRFVYTSNSGWGRFPVFLLRPTET